MLHGRKVAARWLGVLLCALNSRSLVAADAPGVPKPVAELQLDRDVTGVLCSPDGKLLATTSGDDLCLWDAATRRQVWKDRPGAPASMAWSCDGAQLALATSDSIVRVWSVADLRHEPARFRVQQGHLSAMVFSPDGKLLACGGAHVTVGLYDVSAGRELRQFQRQSNWWVGSVGFAANGRQLVAGGYDGLLRVWDCDSGKEMHKLPVPTFTHVAVSPDGKTLITNIDGDKFRVWETATGQPRRDFGKHGPLDLYPLLSPDGRYMVERAKQEQQVRLWDVLEGERLAELSGAGPCAFSADARLIALGAGKSVQFWAVRSFTRERPGSKPLTAAQLESLWADLGGAPAKAQAAIHALANSPAEAAPFLQKQVGAAPAGEKPAPEKLIAELDHDDFGVRERAQRQLTAMGPGVEPALRKVLKQDPSPEMRMRIQQILTDLAAAGPASAELQAMRAIEAMELAGSPACLEAIQAIAKADVPAMIRRDAEGATVRLKRRLSLSAAATKPSN